MTSAPTVSGTLGDNTWFKPEWWRCCLHGRLRPFWPPELDDLDPDPDHPGHLQIDRNDVFAVAAGGGEHRLVRTAVAAYVWGVGKSAFLVGRMVRPFAANSDVMEQRLADVDDVLRTEGAVAAYRSLMWGQRNYLKFFGPAYYTKHLYFTGYRVEVPGPKPLMLDSRVVRALSSRSGFEGITTMSWSPDIYGKFLAFCDSEPGEPEDVEAQLFLEGRRASV